MKYMTVKKMLLNISDTSCKGLQHRFHKECTIIRQLINIFISTSYIDLKHYHVGLHINSSLSLDTAVTVSI